MGAAGSAISRALSRAASISAPSFSMCLEKMTGAVERASAANCSRCCEEPIEAYASADNCEAVDVSVA